MASINLETMKQLLEEFSEKEALTTAEINVIEKEVSNLEQRIVFCHNKLQNLTADREKLASMQERYIKGNFKQYIQNSVQTSDDDIDTFAGTASASNISISPAKSQPSSIGGIENSQIKITSNPSNESQVLPNQAAVAANPQSVPPPISSAKDESQIAEFSQDDSEGANKEGAEPMKSINEALKGLFRK